MEQDHWTIKLKRYLIVELWSLKLRLLNVKAAIEYNNPRLGCCSVDWLSDGRFKNKANKYILTFKVKK